MTVEYILFGLEEMKDMKKGLLESQLGSLQVQQHLHNYKKLRQQELEQKIKLKSMINQIQEELQVLKKLLPETSYSPSQHSKQSHVISELDSQQLIKKEKEVKETSHKSNTLESQLEDIKRKLQMLQ